MAHLANEKTLIICDCEGHEVEIFSSNSINHYKNCDIIVETHDFLKPNSSFELKKNFEPTHNISSVFSLENKSKINEFTFLKKYIFLPRKLLENFVSEERPPNMEWLILKSKRL